MHDETGKGGQHRLADDLPVGAGDEHVGTIREEVRERLGLGDTPGLQDRKPGRLRRRLDGGRLRRPVPAAGPIRVGDDDDRRVMRLEQTFEDESRERRRPGERHPHGVQSPPVGGPPGASDTPSRKARSAAARAARVVRSTMSTPSRWSTSCWMTRASSPSATNST